MRLQVSDPSGHPVRSQVQLVSEANQYRQAFTTGADGSVDARRLPYGIYRVLIQTPGFSPLSESIAIRSALPVVRAIQLQMSVVSQSVTVHASGTLIDPYRAGSVNQIGRQTIQNRLTSLPGRSIQDLVNSEPGWLYEGNAVLHPRGSEYQTQFVIDGIPLTDNRSPGFGPAIGANDIQSMTIYTAGIPAEYGREMGGVVVVDTLQNEKPGLHGQFTLLGGSYATGGIDTQDEYTWGKNTVGLSASGDMTSHYLNPVVPQNYTNNGTMGDFSLNYERQFTPQNHLTMIARHELDRHSIPNELVQQNGAYVPNGNNTAGCPALSAAQPPADCVFVPGGQHQTGDNFETMGIASFEHIFSPTAMAALRGMARDTSLDFGSNPASWPVIVTQHNDFKEVYFNASLTADRHDQEWKAGVESDSKLLNENLSYLIPDCTYPADPLCPINTGILDAAATSFAFTGSRPDLGQAAYLEDAIQFGNWSIDAGLRWDHYQLMVNRNAVSPRLAVSRYFPSVGVKVNGSYDRVFQTPSFENIILSSSPAAQALDTTVPIVQLPVKPSQGNYYQLGATTAFFGKLRLDANMYRRDLNNYADDSQILSTGISFPIAFRKAVIYGAEGKLQVEQWGRFSGFASYSYMVGNVWNPVTGGLFLGGDAIDATSQRTGHSPDSQDQRNTVRDRIRYQVAPRLWVAAGTDYNSGLPFVANQTPQQYATEYGQLVVGHLNFNRGRIHPYFTQNASVSAELYHRENLTMRLQADGENLSNTLELLDFGGLFSGNAIGPGREFNLRLVTVF
ncbi:MAG: TonB-dependent receptor plug domain-containing protein [Acidobacteriota bacterium]